MRVLASGAFAALALCAGCRPAAAPPERPQPGVPGGPIAAAPEVWDPSATRLFIACLAQFEGEKEAGHTSFSTGDRLDGALASALERRGVPRDKSTVLLDDRATSSGVEAAFEQTLDASAPNETLVFYFGSHGGYDAKSGAHSFSTFDGSLPMEWAVDRIEARFKGSRAMLFSDSCYSGGLVELVASKPRRVAYAALSSTSAHEVAYSQWRFIDVLLRAFSGDPRMDANHDGAVGFLEASRFAEHHMAFIAEGKPMYVATGALGDLVIARASGPPPREARIGGYVEVEWHGGWYKAEVQDVRGAEVFVHYTANALHDDDEWITPERVRPLAFATYPKGEGVDVQWEQKWFPATVLDAFDNLHLVHYDGYSSSWDEWVAPSRIRAR